MGMHTYEHTMHIPWTQNLVNRQQDVQQVIKYKTYNTQILHFTQGILSNVTTN